MNRKRAINLTLILVGALTFFHLGILIKIIPYDITWGGRLENDQQMYAFEAFSLMLNLLFGLLLLVKAEKISLKLPQKLVNGGLWMFFGLFALNTVGNIIAETTFEKFFTIVTVLFCVNLWVILRKE